MKKKSKGHRSILGHALPKYLMRAFLLLFCTSALGFSPNNGFSQDAPIRIDNDQTLDVKEIFELIKSQTDYRFVYRDDMIKDAPPVNVQKGIIKTSTLLLKCLKQIGYTANFNGNTIIVVKDKKAVSSISKQQNVDVVGTVKDSLGVPLPGATIRINDTNKATSTGLNGEFQLKDVEIGTVITISYIGYLNQEVEISEESAENLQIVLREDIAKLDEVVLVSTGYQTLSKERSAGSFASPDLDIVLSRTSSMNVAQRLEGLVPGLTVNNSPGARQNPLLIRGLSTVGLEFFPGSSFFEGTPRGPLYVVDGIPINDVVNINPQDVASVTVLKDATAASIWGARAANGVIVITTKSGSATGKVQVQYDGFVSFQGKPDLTYFPVLSSREFIQAAEETFSPELYPWSSITQYTQGSIGVPPHERILYDRYRGLLSDGRATRSLDSLASINNTRQIEDVWYRDAALTNHTISVSGGNQAYSFYGSGTYTGTQNNHVGDKDNRYKINLRQNFDMGKRINIDLITDLTNQVNESTPNTDINKETELPPTIDSRYYPYQLFRDANGNSISMPYMTQLSDSVRNSFEALSRVNLNYNPLEERNFGYTKSNFISSRNILGLKVKIVDGLEFQGTYSLIRDVNKNEVYADHESYQVRKETVEFTTLDPNGGPDPIYLLPTTGGNYSVSTNNSRNWNIRNQISYNKDWNDLHQLNLLVGQEAQERFNVSNVSRVRGYDDRLQIYTLLDYLTLNRPVPGTIMPNYLGAASILDEGYFARSELVTRFTSYYSNAAYTYHSRYSLNGSFRIDQSNLFGLDKSAQNRPIWSVGGKWDLGEEAFLLNNNDALDFLDLRATYGITGNAPNPGTSASFDILASTSSPFFPGQSGLRIDTPGNDKLSWERTATTNVGVDFSFFNRIAGSLDLYRKNTTDLLGIVPTNNFTGYSNVVGNIGELENKGIELSLRTVNLVRGNFRWTSMLNMAYNKNKITDVYTQLETTSGDARVNEQYVTDYPAYAVFAYRYAGLDEVGDPQILLAGDTITKTPNVSRAEDVKYMGTSQPLWSGGFTNTFSYKGLSLNINTIFNLGHVMRRDVNTFYSGRMVHSARTFVRGNVHAEFADRWREPGDESVTDIPAYNANPGASDPRDIDYYLYSDRNVVSASYIKIRDINLSYVLPALLVEKINLQQVTLRAQVSNLMLWKANNDNIDPEFHSASSGQRTLPLNQGAMTVGLNVKF